MNDRPAHTGGRRHRGRPQGRGHPANRRGGAPTQARLLALRVLERVDRTRAYADLALHGALSKSGLSGTDKALATDLVYGTLRWRGRLDYLLSQVLDGDLEKLEPIVTAVLRLGAYQIAFTDRIPATAAVDESVRCVRAAGADRASGLVNAVLRRLAGEYQTIAIPELGEDPLGHLMHAQSLPAWIAEDWLARLGPDEAAALGNASNQVPPRTIRVNRMNGAPEQLIEELTKRGRTPERCRYAPDGLTMGQRGNPANDPAFLEGRYTIQDEASQLVVSLLDPQPGERILDTCAAPGAKATAIAEHVSPDGQVVALDRHPRRLGLVRRDARRLGLTNIQTIERDATTSLEDLVQPAPFDRVLVDAPCSGLGTLRRNPDIRWRVRPVDPERLAHSQLAILCRAATCLRPGGTLVYSTCTVLSEENERVVEELLQADKGLRLMGRDELPEVVRPLVGDDGFLRCLPHLHGTDGFFAARFERTS